MYHLEIHTGSITGLSKAGGRGCTCPQLFGRSYLNREEHIMPTMLLRALSDFRTLRRPCITYEPEVVDRKWFKKTEYKYFKVHIF